MIYVLLFLSAFFLFTGFIITQNNAKYLLNGYNTMRPEEQARFDLEGFLGYFKRFHIWLAASFLVLGMAINTLENDNLQVAFVAGYPILAYIYMIKKSEAYNLSPNTPKENKWGIIVLILTLLVVLLFTFLV